AILVVPLFKKKLIERHGLDNVKVRTVPLPARVMNALLRLRLLPPLDLILGKGTYVFTNYRNWPLLFSKSITYIHDITYLLYPEFLEKKNLKYLIKGIPTWVKRSQFIVTASEVSKNEINSYLGVDNSRIKVIPHGVNRDEYHKIKDKNLIDSTKKKYGIYSEKYLLYVGNLEPRKNLDKLLSAHSNQDTQWKQKYPILLIGARSWADDSIGLKIKDGILNKTVILPSGYVDDQDLPVFYSDAIALVQPAIYEGFGVSPLQALACDTQVLISNIPVFKEIFGNDGAITYLEPDSIDDIGTKLRSVTSNPVDSTAFDKYSWEETATKLTNLINLSEVEKKL
ncbi:MAG: glycosyltransferase family 1 protein, partial [Oscillospiraceae bacterium]